ncbi:MAG: N-formylglutamate amidohydrolase [Emcibacter sp.]|nr:N-formylglutamate amidohydrolase [Emcibacter sp.]
MNHSGKTIMRPFSIFRPKNDPNGILFNSPHSGMYLPEDFLTQITIDPALLHYSGDILVDQLIRDVPKSGATAFINHYARTYVDTNRDIQEIDPEMFHNPDIRPTTKSQKVARGFGIFSRKSYNGQNIYGAKLPATEIDHRLMRVYHPVHDALRNALNDLHQQQGFCLLIDCHSMPSYGFIDPSLSNSKQPDLIIGDCFGTSCPVEFSRRVARFFTERGLKVTFNVPYAGGYNTKTYGKPADQRHAIQLEFSRALYMDEKTLEPHDGFNALQDLLTDLSENVANFFCL